MSTTNLTAGEVMDRSAALMNDPDKTDYTYAAQLPYLKMAIDELLESLEESNNSPSNAVSAPILIPVGKNKITPIDWSGTDPHYPADLVEVQEVGERIAGSSDPFNKLGRKEFLDSFPASSSLMYWMWIDQSIYFNPNGATGPKEVQLKYIWKYVGITDESSDIGIINSMSYLSYKTAALCAQFIGENPERASLLENKAMEAMERLTGINNKGRQQIFTRRRPFRAAYKSRGWY